MRRLVSPSWMVTVLPAWLKPTWMRWRATWTPPRVDTFRWMVRSAGGSGAGPARRTPWSLCRWPGRVGAGQAAPQDAVLGEDVHDLAVEPDPGVLPGQRGADLDDLVAQGDDAGGVDQPLHFHAAGRGQGSWCRSCRGRSW